MNYYVTWGIEIEADTPQEAARVARTIQLNPESIANYFELIDDEGEVTPVDLDDLGE